MHSFALTPRYVASSSSRSSSTRSTSSSPTRRRSSRTTAGRPPARAHPSDPPPRRRRARHGRGSTRSSSSITSTPTSAATASCSTSAPTATARSSTRCTSSACARGWRGKPSVRLRRLEIDPDRRRVATRELADVDFELPRIDYAPRQRAPYRYAYGVGQRTRASAFIDQLAKVDVRAGRRSTWRDRGCFPGEPVFVRRPGGRARGRRRAAVGRARRACAYLVPARARRALTGRARARRRAAPHPVRLPRAARRALAQSRLELVHHGPRAISRSSSSVRSWTGWGTNTRRTPGWPSISRLVVGRLARTRSRRRAPPACPALSNSSTSRRPHDTQEPQSASASMTASQRSAISRAHVGRRGLGEGRLGRALDGVAALAQQALELVEEDVAARLADVEQRDPRAVPARARRSGRLGRARARAVGSRISVSATAPRSSSPAPSLSRPPPSRRRPSRTGRRRRPRRRAGSGRARRTSPPASPGRLTHFGSMPLGRAARAAHELAGAALS